MKKIPTLFKRDYQGNHQVYNELTEGTEWVANGEGWATAKRDGTCCMVKDGNFYRRLELKKGKAPPLNFEPAQESDPITGKIPGWLPVDDSNPSDKWCVEALHSQDSFLDGTYELLGPKVQGNKYNLTRHILEPHGVFPLEDVPRDYEGIRSYLADHPEMEGVVWWHPDGRMAKIKRRDFGLVW